MRVWRQLGSCGTILVFGPVLWLGACWASRALAQHAYDTQITPLIRKHRVEVADIAPAGLPVRDRRTLVELEKYIRVWALEPGASADFPDADRFPFSLNPFRATATFMRLKQKQAFLLSQHHRVTRARIQAPGGREAWRYEIIPDPSAALGGRRFIVTCRGNDVVQATELPG